LITVKLKGGLGNQMFQYAMARRTAWAHKVRLKLDISWFENVGTDTLRAYELKHFKIIENFATKKEMGLCIRNPIYRRIEAKLVPIKWRSYITERQISFDADMMQLRDNIYIDGNWGNEKYFLDIKEIIQQEFQLRNPLDELNRKMAELIGTSYSISVDV